MQQMKQGNYFHTTFCFFKKSIKLGKSKSSATWFHYISMALKLAYNKKQTV